MKQMQLSNLSVTVVLDHAGGHGTTNSKCRVYHCNQILPSNDTPTASSTPVPHETPEHPPNAKSTPVTPVESTPFSHEIPKHTAPAKSSPVPREKSTLVRHETTHCEGFHPALPTLTKIHSKKKYIRLKRPVLEQQSQDSQKEAPAAVRESKAHTESPLSPPRRRYSLDSTFRARRRNSAGDDTCSNKLLASPAAGKLNRRGSTQSPSPRSASLRALRQFARSPRQERRQQPMGETMIVPQEVHDASHEKWLVDSPEGSYTWVPKGYQPLVPAAPDLCSVTSSSTYSSSVVK